MEWFEYSSQKIHVHPETQNETLLGIKIFVHVNKITIEIILDSSGPQVSDWGPDEINQ